MERTLRKMFKTCGSPLPAFWCGVLLGLAMSFVVIKSSPKRKAIPGAFWLTVQVTFKRAEDVDIFKTAFAPLAAFVEKNEPRTLSYSMAQSDKDPKTVLLFERYVDKNDAYLEVHRKSAPFKEVVHV